MILIVTEQADLSADLVVEELGKRSAPFARLNCDRLLLDAWVQAEAPAHSSFKDENGETFALGDVRAVWYRRPRLPIVERDMSPPLAQFAQREAWSQALGVLLALDAYWMSDPAAIWRANHKTLQLAVASAVGLRVPRTCITRDPDAAWAFIRSVDGPVVAKPVTYGSLEGTDPELAVYTTRLPPFTRDELASLTVCPVIFQEEITKRRDVRVTIIGEAMFAVAIESQRFEATQTDWRRPVNGHLPHTPIDLQGGIARALRELMHRLHLEFGAVDLVEALDGNFYFLEVNPNGQWGWLELETGIGLSTAIAARLARGKS